MNTHTQPLRISAFWAHQCSLPLIALGLIVLINFLFHPEFFNIYVQDGRYYGSLIDILNRSAPCALVALGMSLVIATGGIDLSVGAVIAISGAVCANLLTGATDPTSLLVVVSAGLMAGLVAGAVNGGLVSALRIQPIVATLVLMVAGRGIAQLMNDGQIVTFDQPSFAFIGVGSLFGIPFPIVLVLFIFIILQALTRLTSLGLLIESVGCNPKASHYMGLPVRAIQWGVYCVSGLCAALAGLIITADIQGADANNAGMWIELDAILAVVLGGAALAGGRFSLPMTLLGVLIIQTMTTTILMSGLEPKYNLMVKSFIIITVLLFQSPVWRAQWYTLWQRCRSFGKVSS